MTATSDLESRAAAGELEAQFELGSELLSFPDSARSFTRGAALVEAAALQGHAEAMSMLATLEAIGAGRPRNWIRALDLLRSAAARGSEQAAGQLRLLGGANAGVEIAALLRAPPPTPLSERPRLRVFEGFARAAECRWIIDRMRCRLGPAMVWDDADGRGKVDPVRSNSAVELRLAAMDVVTALVRARIAAATALPEAIFEVPQVMHYSVGQEFRPHHDFLDPGEPGPAADIARRGQRMGTFLLYLNDDFEGGETEFPRAGLSHRGRAGDALFFANVLPDGRPDALTVHSGRSPRRGEKWILSQWIRDRIPG